MEVKISKLAKYFQFGDEKITALKDVACEIEPGEFISIVGPSGCGKSTLLRLIAGLDVPDEGEVIVRGKVVKDAGPDRGVVFQEAALFPWLTVRLNVEFGLKLRGYDSKETFEKAEKYIKMVHLGKFVNALPHQLSGGMKQRVSIARALALNPEILLMDEPFASLDAQTRTLLHIELQQIWEKTGKTIIFITHNVREAVTLSSRVFVMSARPGTIVEEFKIDLASPRNESNTNIIYYQNKIMKVLRGEIEKVLQLEIDREYKISEDSVLPPASVDMGGSI